MRFFLQGLIFLLFMVLLPLKEADAKPHLVFARGDGDYPPFEMQTALGTTGIHIDMVHAVAKQLGWHIDIISLPWKRALAKLKSGEVDAVLYMSWTLARADYTYYLNGNILSEVQLGFAVLSARRPEFRYQGELQALAQYQFAEQRGFYYGDMFESADYLHKTEYDSIDTIFKLLRKRRMDIALYERQRLHYEQSIGINQDMVMLTPILDQHAAYLGFSKSRALAKEALAFADAMDAFKQTSAYRQLLKRYGQKVPGEPEPNEYQADSSR